MTIQINSNEDKSYKVTGYAATWDRYLLFDAEREQDKIYEQFTPECFKECDMSDVIFQYNHTGKVFARTSNETLRLNIDDHGLFIEADLSSTEASKGMFEEIATGLVTKMSWGFNPLEYKYDRETQTIIHSRVKKVFDVSAVSFPANDSTEISARDFVNGEIDKVLKEFQTAERQRRQLELKLKLVNF